jgi:hypothetical protein
MADIAALYVEGQPTRRPHRLGGRDQILLTRHDAAIPHPMIKDQSPVIESPYRGQR